MSTPDLHIVAGSAARAPFALDLDADRCGWSWCGLRILECQPGQRVDVATGETELLVLPLSGSCDLTVEGTTWTLHGRDSVFTSTTDFAYIPMHSEFQINSHSGGRFALPATRAQRRLEPAYHPATDIDISLRGAGSCSRQINGIAMDGFGSDHLMVCEVLTPAANWSSYPPHKHDEDRDGECALEEIYYFEVAESNGRPGVAYQRVYGTTERPIDVLAEVRTGDVVLVPHGWHGPSMASPGHDLYYLNVMAGPKRIWKFHNSVEHEWLLKS